MDQSPKAKFLRAKYIARERERQWYWRAVIALQKCCQMSKKKDDKEDEHVNFAPEILIPRLVKINQIIDVSPVEAIKQLVAMECNEAIEQMINIHRRRTKDRLSKIEEMTEVLQQEAIQKLEEKECKEAIKEMVNIYRDQTEKQMIEIKQSETTKDMLEIQQDRLKYNDKPWARRRHYYNERSYDAGLPNEFGEEEPLPYYKPWSVNHLDQGYRPWARRRHYYNENRPDSKPFPTPAANLDNHEEEYKPWARRRHYYNENASFSA